MFFSCGFIYRNLLCPEKLLDARMADHHGWLIEKTFGHSLFQWFHTLKPLYFIKAYFSFTWHLESPYTDLLQFKHKCTYFFATNLKNKQYTRWNTGETYKKLTRESYFFKTALHVFYIRDTFISNTGWDLIQNNNSQVS